MKFIPQTLVILLFAVSLRAVAIEGNIELKFAGSGLPIASPERGKYPVIHRQLISSNLRQSPLSALLVLRGQIVGIY